MSYYREEHPADSIGTRPLTPFEHNEHVWKTKSGKEIPYSELTTSHIMNILKLIRRNWHLKTEASKEEKVKTVEVLYQELSRRKRNGTVQTPKF